MKKILSTLICCTLFLFGFSQKINLKTNGHLLKFKAIDTLFYAEYSNNSAMKRNAIKEDFYSVNLKYNFGQVSKNRHNNTIENPIFTSNYYVYTDGTLQSPTTELFFKPINIFEFKKLFSHIGLIEEHKVLKGYYYLNVTDNKYNTGESIFKLCEIIYKSNLVSIIEPVFSKLLRIENPLRPGEWNIRNSGTVAGGIVGADMQVENAWCSSTGTGIRVAVIDDGVDLTHPDLLANLLPGYDATGNNSGGAPTTNNPHGTNCAGIIASVDNTIGAIGVAYNARIIPIRQGIVSGGFYNTNETWQTNCFNEAVARGADVISNSWGGGSPSAQLEAAIQNALTNGRGGKGCIVLFAAGNRNSTISYPSSLANVISVGASTPCDTRKRSSNDPTFVNPGVNTDPEGTSCDGEFQWGSNFGTGLDLMAPGVHISTTDLVGFNGYSFDDYFTEFNGTSSACPNAAAVVALILSANQNLTGAQARNILEQTCDKVGGYNYQSNVSGQPNGTWTSQAGYGRINADKAVLMALGQVRNITGSDPLCSSGSTYFLNGIPCNSTVTWSVTSNAGGNPSLSNTSGSSTSIILPSNFPISASIILSATISGITNPITKTIFYGQPGFGATYKNGVTSGNPVAIYFPSQGNNNTFNNVCIGYGGVPNVYIDGQPYGTNNLTWSVPNGYATSAFSLYTGYGNRTYFAWNYGGTTPPGYIQGTVNNSCGTYSQIFAFQQVNCGTPGGDPCTQAKGVNYFTISPNPAIDIIKIGIANKPPPIKCNNLRALNTSNGIVFSTVNVYNNVGTLVKSYNTKNAKAATIQIGNLIAGSYLVEIIQSDYIEKQQIILQK
jgi:subtilisin family serine protease